MKIIVNARPGSRLNKIERLNPPVLEFKDSKAEVPVYKIWVTAQPIDGKANQAIINLLSKHFKVPNKSIRLIQGEASKRKIFEIL